MPTNRPYGLNLPNKSLAATKPGNPFVQKRKNIFDDDSDEDQQTGDGAIEITTIGGLEEPATKKKPPPSAGPPPKRKIQFGSGPKPTAKPLSKNSLFADDEDEDEEREKEQQGSMNLGLNQAKPKKPTAPAQKYTNLASMHSSNMHAKAAEELDPLIYSYDEVYDSLHAKPAKASVETKSETPKYMQNLLQSAEIRKRDQLRAKDRQLAREREAEGDEFADKDKFVTSAYKAQQAELRKAEEEEARREKEEEERRKKSGGAGMIGFYRDVLSRGEARHEEVIKAAEETARRMKAGEIIVDTEDKEEKTDAQKAEDLNAHGARIVVNDEGQVVDKRQLLSAGLNVAPKLKSQAAPKAEAPRPTAGRPGAGAGYQGGRGAQRARQTDMVASQYEERARQEEEAEAARLKEIAEKSRSRKTEKDVSSAKERYLARKREREEAAAREKSKGA
ncbi:uncharacterized protein N7479_004686 [Penicillium vulpinum]|uniref:Nuclear speckle splicing regulatory protein 1 N-terminal domain-containing protein n=1 Tax=Penicillium vulpinum TaxID=29845 RepID=A0A1V6RMJ5_9EURO|nr:uncharacterized protein N7479_004686 [Penicillium vulpinum]KAJ5964810.1 hypothetical protein N7479_004686 [Penicillium vulpinum]OQE02768.1 hypothetical protein PENVUL_c038G00816 [Penicillium vulpinum]